MHTDGPILVTGGEQITKGDYAATTFIELWQERVLISKGEWCIMRDTYLSEAKPCCTGGDTMQLEGYWQCEPAAEGVHMLCTISTSATKTYGPRSITD